MTILELILLVFSIPLASLLFINNLNHGFAFLIFVFAIFLDGFSLQILGGLFQIPQLIQMPVSRVLDSSLLEEIEILFSMFVPIMIYSNADSDKLKVLADNKGKAGIYQWTHLESGKRYIGSAFNLTERMYNYYSIKFLDIKLYIFIMLFDYMDIQHLLYQYWNILIFRIYLKKILVI
jgi:hypothetical protein